MTGTDLEACIKFFAKHASGRKFRRILLIEPDVAQHNLIKTLFPEAETRAVFYPAFDASKDSEGGGWDMVFLANTFMTAVDPKQWFSNLLSIAEEIWTQELVRAWRNGHEELAKDTGDVTRFTFPKRGEESRVPGYDLESNLDVSIEELEFYNEPMNYTTAHDCRKFMAIIRKRVVNAGDAGSGMDGKEAEFVALRVEDRKRRDPKR